MTAESLKQKIETLSPGTRAEISDLTGTGDHWKAVVISDAFEGRSTVDRHKLVMGLLSREIASNEVHALMIRTFTPAQSGKGLNK